MTLKFHVWFHFPFGEDWVNGVGSRTPTNPLPGRGKVQSGKKYSRLAMSTCRCLAVGHFFPSIDPLLHFLVVVGKHFTCLLIVV